MIKLTDGQKREFLHTLSRISDRLEQIESDVQDIQGEAGQHTEAIAIKAAKAKGDTQKLRSAVETLAQDYLGTNLQDFKKGNRG